MVLGAHASLDGMVPDDGAVTLPADNVAGFYHDPPLWLVEHPIDHAQKGGTFGVEFDRLDQEVLCREVGGGLKMRAIVEGMFAFDFSGVAHLAISGKDYSSVGRIYWIALQRTRMMNAYLAFFYTQRTLIDKQCEECMVITPEIVIRLLSLDNSAEGGFVQSASQPSSHVALSLQL